MASHRRSGSREASPSGSESSSDDDTVSPASPISISSEIGAEIAADIARSEESDGRPVAAASPPPLHPPGSYMSNILGGYPNHALHDYNMQLRLLESQNKRRLTMAREEQDVTAASLKESHAQKPATPDEESEPQRRRNSSITGPQPHNTTAPPPGGAAEPKLQHDGQDLHTMGDFHRMQKTFRERNLQATLEEAAKHRSPTQPTWTNGDGPNGNAQMGSLPSPGGMGIPTAMGAPPHGMRRYPAEHVHPTWANGTATDRDAQMGNGLGNLPPPGNLAIPTTMGAPPHGMRRYQTGPGTYASGTTGPHTYLNPPPLGREHQRQLQLQMMHQQRVWNHNNQLMANQASGRNFMPGNVGMRSMNETIHMDPEYLDHDGPSGNILDNSFHGEGGRNALASPSGKPNSQNVSAAYPPLMMTSTVEDMEDIGPESVPGAFRPTLPTFRRPQWLPPTSAAELSPNAVLNAIANRHPIPGKRALPDESESQSPKRARPSISDNTGSRSNPKDTARSTFSPRLGADSDLANAGPSERMTNEDRQEANRRIDELTRQQRSESSIVPSISIIERSANPQRQGRPLPSPTSQEESPAGSDITLNHPEINAAANQPQLAEKEIQGNGVTTKVLELGKGIKAFTRTFSSGQTETVMEIAPGTNVQNGLSIMTETVIINGTVTITTTTTQTPGMGQRVIARAESEESDGGW
jgi:hypothetical protein